MPGEPERPLPLPLRVILVPWNALMTAACFTMFTWIVHDRRMPGWPAVLDRVASGPAVHVARGTLAAAAVDAGLFALFGLVHAGAARRAVYRFLGEGTGLVHRQALRTVFMTLTAAAWLALVFLWQPTGAYVWDLRPALARAGVDPRRVDDVSHLVSFGFVLLCLGTVVRHGVFRFVGLRQLLAGPERTDAMGGFVDPGAAPRPVLLTTGIYGVVRHPMYMYLLAAVVVRPALSLDLAVWFACAVAFLLVALPLEEEKLVATFGDAYREYRRRTPAFVPFWPASWTLAARRG